jgi:Na+-transporting NADH:ubiquinone oxidoreductase subunit NqrB
VLAGCVLLWLHRRNAWALLALAGEAGTIACHAFLLITPSAFTEFPQLRVVWPLTALVFAVGFAGYAWTEFSSARVGAPGVMQ